MTFDNHSLFGYSDIIDVVSQDASSVVIEVNSGDGDKFSINQQVVIYPDGAIPKIENAMVGRLTGITGDQLTISIVVGNREGSSVKTVQVNDKIINAITPKIFTDIETELTTHETDTGNPHSVTKTQVGLGNVTDDAQLKSADLDTDTALAANSDTKIPSQKAVKAYADGLVTGLLDDRGNYDASVNTFPATGGSGTAGAVKKGDMWLISVAGTLGGVAVNVGDQVRALSDTPGQTSGNWAIMEGNLGYVPENSVNKSTDDTLVDDSDTKYPSQSAVKGYVDTEVTAINAEIVKKISKNSNYKIQDGVLIENFETLGDWTVGGSGSIAADTTHHKNGISSLELTAALSSNVYATKTVSLDLSQQNPIKFSLYVADPSNISTITIYFAQESGFTNYFSKAFSTAANFVKGWNTITVARAQFNTTGSPSWATITRIRVRLDTTSGGSQVVSFDSLIIGEKHRPKIVLTFDDGWAVQHSEAYSYMVTKGIRATCFVPYSKINTTNYMTDANLQTLYAAGWDIANHTYNHVNLTTLATQAEMETEIQTNADRLKALGFTRSADHFAYPNGAYNDTVLLALAAQGVLTARTVIGVAAWRTPQPPDDFYHLRIQNLGNTTSLASVEQAIDLAEAEGSVLFINGHILTANPTVTTEWAITDFHSLVDYIKAKEDAGLIDVPVVSEWYNGLIGVDNDTTLSQNSDLLVPTQKAVKTYADLAIGTSAATKEDKNISIVTKAVADTPYAILSTDRLILVNAVGGATTVTLPTAVGITGRRYIIKKIDSSAYLVTIATTSSQTIDGVTTRIISSQYSSIEVVSDGSNWHIDLSGRRPNRKYLKPYHGEGAIAVTDQAATAGRVLMQLIDIPEDCYVNAIIVANGSAIAGNVTVGMYGPLVTEDTSYQAPVAVQSASVAISGSVNVPQSIPMIETFIRKGRYYIAVQWDSTSSRYLRISNQTQVVGWAQLYDRGGGYGALTDPCPTPTNSGSAMPGCVLVISR